MKLQKQLSRKIAGTEYVKWVVVIPPKKIKEIDWKDGEELDVDVRKGALFIRRKHNI